MKENYLFRPIKEGVEKNQAQEKTEFKPITATEYEDTELRPMSLKDQWLTLRYSIQEKISPEALTPDQQKPIKLMDELITPQLINEYKQIIRNFNAKAQKTEDHPKREFIDIDSNEQFTNSIKSWINNLLNEVKKESKLELDENDLEELRAQCWTLFYSITNVLNSHSIEKDINEFYQDKDDNISKHEAAKQRGDLIQQLQERYPFDKTEIEILCNLIKPDKDQTKDYSLKLLVETITRLWYEYKLNEKKGTIAGISLGYLLARGAESFAPSLFKNLIINDKFHVETFLEFFGCNRLSQIMGSKIDIQLAKVINDINQQINERITNSIFFQEFEFIHEQSLGQIYTTLERGKDATRQLLQDTISTLVPTLEGIALSLGFLTKLNPYLGAIGTGGLPFMYIMAKKQNSKIGSMYSKERQEETKIATRLDSIKTGFETIKVSPETPTIATDVVEQMNNLDKLSLNRFIKETRMRLLRIIPFDISTIVAAGVGGYLQHLDKIPGGAILANITYSSQLNRPVQELVNLYFNRFARYIQDIEKMDEIFGQYDKLDLPEGEKEQNRLPVSKLPNCDISIQNLYYKDILRGINLDIHQGEFITITGPSGAGKTTLLRNLTGLYKPDAGEIKIGGINNDQIKKYGNESLYSIMSYCNQNPQIFREMTLRENLLLWSKKEVNDEQIQQVLHDLQLDKLINKLDNKIEDLSGGEKVRIGVARTLIKGAKILLLDEPTASLDSQAATEVRKIITTINTKYPDTTIICVSHDEEFKKISKRSIDITNLQQ